MATAYAEEIGTPAVQIAQAETFEFNLPGQALSEALTELGAVTGLRVLYMVDLPDSLRTRPLSGNFTAEKALQNLLAGSGFTYQFTNPTTVTLIATVGDGSTLAPLSVEDSATQETANSPIDGYVAKQSATGTKTDTPLIETPQSISVISAERLAAQGVSDLGEALRYTAGVNGEQYGVDSRGYGLTIRGFGVSDTGLYRDGMQLRGTGFSSFLQIDPYAAERIEILRGPASVLYGQNNPGGIVNMVTKRPQDEAKHEVSITGGDPERYQGQFDLTGPVDEGGTLLYRITGLGRDGDTQVDFVDHERYFIAPSVTWQPNDDTTLTFLGHYQRDETGWSMQFLPASGTVLNNSNGTIPTNRFVGEPDFDKYNVTQYSAGYQFEHRFGDTWTVRQNLRYNHLDNEQEGVFGNGLVDDRTLARYGDAGKSSLDSVSIDNQLQAKFDTGPLSHTTLFGVDFQHYDYSDVGTSYLVSDIDVFDPDYGSTITKDEVYQDTDITQRQIGLYLQDQVKIDKNWNFVFGGRYDWAKTHSDDNLDGPDSTQKDSAFTGRLGFVYVADNGLAPYISYSESFVPLIGTNADGSLFKPETGRQYEVGIKYQPEGWDSFITVAAFDLRRQNVLTPDPADPANSQVQTGEIMSRGIEVEGVASFDFGLDLIGAYTFLDAEIIKSNVDGEEGERPGAVPEHMASLWADYTIPSGNFAGLGLGTGVRYIGSTYAAAPNTLRVPGVTLADATLHYEIDNFHFGLNVSNIFDTEYVASCFGESSCFYGERRQILGTLRVTW